MPLATAEHFVRAPEWTWYVLFYFFLAGLAGGSYFIATLLRHWGNRDDEPVARLGFYVAFPATVISGEVGQSAARPPRPDLHTSSAQARAACPASRPAGSARLPRTEGECEETP